LQCFFDYVIFNLCDIFFIKYFLVFAGEGYASSNPKAKTISPKGGKKDEQV